MAKEKPYNINLLSHSLSEKTIHIGTLGVLFLGILFFGSVFEVSYPQRLVELYAFPWWRLLLVCFVAISTWWCPRVGLLTGLATFLYLNDMHTLTTPFIGTK
jgi:hypothetical protein